MDRHGLSVRLVTNNKICIPIYNDDLRIYAAGAIARRKSLPVLLAPSRRECAENFLVYYSYIGPGHVVVRVFVLDFHNQEVSGGGLAALFLFFSLIIL